MYFQLKTNSVGITEVSVLPMAIDIQWIITSYYQKGYELYRKILCASKFHAFNLVLIFCPDSTDAAK